MYHDILPSSKLSSLKLDSKCTTDAGATPLYVC